MKSHEPKHEVTLSITLRFIYVSVPINIITYINCSVTSSKKCLPKWTSSWLTIWYPERRIGESYPSTTEIEKSWCRKVDNCCIYCFKVFNSDIFQILSTGGIEKQVLFQRIVREPQVTFVWIRHFDICCDGAPLPSEGRLTAERFVRRNQKMT